MNLAKLFPFWGDIKKYKGADWGKDITAGFTVAVMLVPQGMAYALLAGMPPVYGLYAGLIPLVLYGILGTSRQLSIGPVAISALLVLAGISKLAVPGSAEYIELVILTGLGIGLFQLLLGIFRMGFFVNFLSHPVIVGFTSAAAIIITISQLKDVLGFSIPNFDHILDTVIYAFQHLEQSNWISVVLCIGSIIVISLLRKINRAIPGALIVVIIGILITWWLGLDKYGLDIVGEVPEGLPVFSMPESSFENIKKVLPTVIVVGVIGVVESMSIAKVLEAKHQNYSINANQDLIALGVSKIGGAFFQALPSSASFTRSAVNNDSGARSGFASLITALLIALSLIFFTSAFYYLPKAILAAIILLAVKSLFDIEEAIHLWKIHRIDFLMMVLTFVMTLVFGIEKGVLSGIAISIFAVLYRNTKPHIAVLGNFPGTSIYRNIDRFEEVQQIEGALIVRFDNQLFFSNAEAFKDGVNKLINTPDRHIHTLILDAASIHEIDSSGLAALSDLHKSLIKKGITLKLCSVIGPVRDMLYGSGLMHEIGVQNQFMTVHDAVLCMQQKIEDQGRFTKNAIQTNIESE